MIEYRIYFLDSAGHFQGVKEITCIDDDQARGVMRASRDGRPMELWQRDRLVGRFPPHAGSEQP